MNVRIYAPAKTAMQSGKGKTGSWVLEGVTQTPKTPDPLMGWASAGDTLNQIKLYFDSKDQAIQYAEKNNYNYTVKEAKERTIKPKSYASNFTS